MNKKISANLANTAKECIENGLDATAIFVNLDMKDSWFDSIK
jgi:DNA mismatch repair ATPase MutL